MTITTAQENLMWVGHIPGNVDHSIGVLLTKAVPISDEFGAYVIGLSLQTHSAGLSADQVAKLIHAHLREKCGLCSCLYAPRYLVMDSGSHTPYRRYALLGSAAVPFLVLVVFVRKDLRRFFSGCQSCAANLLKARQVYSAFLCAKSVCPEWSAKHMVVITYCVNCICQLIRQLAALLFQWHSWMRHWPLFAYTCRLMYRLPGRAEVPEE
eukprot:COSAG01_NODE_2896_length_6894_cov_4.250147_5_plen_210_part_00